MTRIPGIEDSVRRGRSTRKVRSAEKLPTPAWSARDYLTAMRRECVWGDAWDEGRP